MQVRAFIYSLCLVAELILFMYVYIQGEHGLYAVRTLAGDCMAVEQSCIALQKEVHYLNAEIADWEQYPFYRESFARKNFQMGYPQEEWFQYEESV